MVDYGQPWTKEYDNVDQCVCGLSIVGKGDKHGFVDKDGELIVPLIYYTARTFSENMAAVKQNGKWIIIDNPGKKVADAE